MRLVASRVERVRGHWETIVVGTRPAPAVGVWALRANLAAIPKLRDRSDGNVVVNVIVNFVEDPRRTPIKFATKFTMKLVAAQPPLSRSKACEKA